MTSRAVLLALLAMWGVGTAPALPAFAEEAPVPESRPSDLGGHGLVDRVWSRVMEDGLPGAMKIFLSDGTLVQDSCWETYRLSPWTQVSDKALEWDEDGMAIKATIASLTESELVLTVNGAEERYTAAQVPYLCPDMPKA